MHYGKPLVRRVAKTLGTGRKPARRRLRRVWHSAIASRRNSPRRRALRRVLFIGASRQTFAELFLLITRRRKGDPDRPLSDVWQACVRPSPSWSLAISAKKATWTRGTPRQSFKLRRDGYSPSAVQRVAERTSSPSALFAERALYSPCGRVRRVPSSPRPTRVSPRWFFAECRVADTVPHVSPGIQVAEWIGSPRWHFAEMAPSPSASALE